MDVSVVLKRQPPAFHEIFTPQFDVKNGRKSSVAFELQQFKDSGKLNNELNQPLFFIDMFSVFSKIVSRLNFKQENITNLFDHYKVYIS